MAFQIIQSFFYLQFKSKTYLKSCILGSNLVSDLGQVGRSKVHCLVQYFSSPLEDISWILFCHENNQLYMSRPTVMYGQGAQAPLIQIK